MPVISIIVIVLLLSAIAIAAVAKRNARATGMSSHTPVCGNCLYRVGGWSSPICPECGSDIRNIGVRIGPRTPRHLLNMLIVLTSIFGVEWLCMVVFGWLFATANFSWHTRWTSADEPKYHITITAKWKWRRFPPHHDFTGTIDFVLVGPHVSGSWLNGRWNGPPPVAQAAIDFAGDEPAPSRQRIALAINVVASQVPSEIRERQINDVTAEIQGIWDSAANGTLNKRNYTVPPPGGRFTGGSGGYGGGSGAGWPAALLTFVAIVAFAVIGTTIVNRTYEPGWRNAHIGEWEQQPASLINEHESHARETSHYDAGT